MVIVVGDVGRRLLTVEDSNELKKHNTKFVLGTSNPGPSIAPVTIIDETVDVSSIRKKKPRHLHAEES